MADLTLRQLSRLPPELLEADARDLHALLGGPALLHLDGHDPRPLFVSVLLHGNEITGLLAVQRLLRKYRTHPLPRALTVFFGNTRAAAAGVRRLDGQPDYNRVWPGTDRPDCPEARLMAEVRDIMRRRRVFASIDVHNNTGVNPHYACVNRLDPRFLHLASLFGRLVVYFLRPRGVQSMAFAELCPAVTLECGKPGAERGTEHACDFIDTCLHLESIPDSPPPHLDLFHTVAQVKIRDGVRFSFTDETADLVLRSDLDRLNFTELPAGIAWGEVHDDAVPLAAVDEDGRDVTGRYFAVVSGKSVLRQPVMPSMLTLDERIIRQDCLGYLMERLDGTEAG